MMQFVELKTKNGNHNSFGQPYFCVCYIYSLNAVREICSRCPLAMGTDLLQDLVQYKSYKNKAVVAAARSLIQLFRGINPEMLHKRDRVSQGVVPVVGDLREDL